MRTLTLIVAGLTSVYALPIEHVAGGHDSATSPDVLRVRLNEPFAVAFNSNGEWYICEHKGERILRVDKSGKAFLFAGTGNAGFSGDGGPATQATFRDPHGIVVSRRGVMLVADTLNHAVRAIDLKTGIITTVAGTGEKGFSGDGGPAAKATFNGTFGIALSPAHDRLYIADLNNRRVRMIDLKSGVVSTVAGNGEKGEPVDGSVAAQSPLVDPRAITVDSRGNLYILERGGNALRVVGRDGRIRTVVRPGAVTPDLNGPKHLCADRQDNIIIADAENNLVRLFDSQSGKLKTIAGNGQKGSRMNADDPLSTELNRPHGVAVNPSGELYLIDSYNHRVLKMTY